MDLHSGIMAGQYDLVILALCKTVTSLESEVTIRWGHEMDFRGSIPLVSLATGGVY